MAAISYLPRVLVTGGAGYIGSHVCKALLQSGYRPVTYDDLSDGHRWAVRWGPLEQGSLADRDKLMDAMRRHRPVAVIHLAGLIAAGESVVDPAKFYDHNVVGTLCLLEAMRSCGIDRIVFSSSAAVYGEPLEDLISEAHQTVPTNPYGATKLACESALHDFSHAYDIRGIALRYFNAAGADPDGEIGEAHRIETHLVPLVLDAAAGNRPVISVFGTDFHTRDGTCIRDYVHVADLAQAHVLAMRHLEQEAGFHAFNLGNGSGFSVREVIDAAERVTGRTIPIRYEDRRPGDPAMLVADSTRARRILGWQPTYADLEDQILTAWNWLHYQRAITWSHDEAASFVAPSIQSKREGIAKVGR